VQEVIQKKGTVEYDDLALLPKLTAFIKETLRLRTPAPGLIPRRARLTHYIKDVKIEKGSTSFQLIGWFVNIALQSIQSNAKYFDNGTQF
jgi:cytochrome P450